MNKTRNFILKTMTFGLLLGLTASIKADGKATVMQPIRAAMEKPLKAAHFVANAVGAAARHPKIIASVAIGSSALYLIYKKIYAQDWDAAIKGAACVTHPMLRNVAKPGSQYAYLLFEEYPTAFDLVNNKNAVYARLLNCAEREEPSVIKAIIKDITAEKKNLEHIKAGLEECLYVCTLLPQFEIVPSNDEDGRTENSVTKIIDSNKNRLGFRGRKFHELTNDVIRTINQEILDVSAISIFNPHKLLRYWVLPFESKAMREYWKIRQLIERLNAIEFCLTQRSIMPRLPVALA